MHSSKRWIKRFTLPQAAQTSLAAAIIPTENNHNKQDKPKSDYHALPELLARQRIASSLNDRTVQFSRVRKDHPADCETQRP